MASSSSWTEDNTMNEVKASVDAGSDTAVESIDEEDAVSPRVTGDDTDDAVSITSSSSSIHSVQKADSTVKNDTHPVSGIDSLVLNMKRALVIKDVTVQAPSTIAVPKGYMMTESTSPDSHYRAQRLVRMHVKRKRSEEVLAQPSIRSMIKEQYGFLSEEINSSGAIATYDCQSSQLSNEIHPFFSRSRFDDTPDTIYDQLLPAIRLASRLLTQPACMQYWITLALGERKHDEEMSQKYGSYCHRIHQHVEMTDQNIALVMKELEDLATANVVHFVFRHREAMPLPDVWACSTLIWEHRAGRKRNLTRSLVRLHTDYYTVAKKLSQLKYPEKSQVLRFSFHFATVLLHELAHSIDFAYQANRCYGRQDLHTVQHYMEPFFLDSKSPPECGRFLEQVLFGGEIQPINKRTDGSHGLCTSEWPPRSLTSDSERRQWYTIPMEYVQSVFLTATWESKAQQRDYKAFHIPRTGTASAIYLNSCTTMEWSKSDDAAEALVLAKAQPACKKRLTATGAGEDQRREEDAAVSYFFWELEAIRMEEASRRFGESSSSRRHSFHAKDVEDEDEDSPRPKKKNNRSRSAATLEISTTLTQKEYDVLANDLRSSFRAFYDKLPAHNGSESPNSITPTSETVKRLAKKSGKPRRRTSLSAVDHHSSGSPEAEAEEMPEDVRNAGKRTRKE